jgi:hypothetical protein
LQRPQSIDAIISAEKTRKEEPKQTPNPAKTPRSSSVYNDETTIIAEPKPKKERKTEAPNPRPKESNHDYSQTPPKQESYSSSHIKDNGGGELSKNTIILMVGALLFAVLFVLYHVSGSTSAPDQEPTPAPTETTVQKVERMQYTTAIGGCQYTGPVDEQRQPNGEGEAFFNDGRYYSGTFEHGVLTGDDCYFKYANGDTFRGKFRNNSFYFGRYTIAKDQSYFDGYYSNGQPSSGNWYDKNGKTIESI